MPTDAISLILLGYTRFGDTGMVLHTLSREYGRRGFIARPGKGGGKMALFLPLNLLEGEVSPSGKSNLWPVRKISSRHPLIGIRNNMYKNTMTLFMSETIMRVVRDGMMEDGLYEWLEKSILTLDALEGDFSNFPIRFLLELCQALGFRPGPLDMAPFSSARPDVMGSFLEGSFAESMLIPLSGAERNAISEDLVRYLRFHTESNFNIRSLKVLRELYSA